MARITLARTGALVVLALSALGACDRPGSDNGTRMLPTEVSFAKGSNNGGGKGGNASATQPTMAITPTELSMTVGQQFTVAVTYWDNRGNVIPVNDDKLVYYGCRKLADTDPDCYSVIGILPLQPKGREAQLTAKAPGSVIVWAYDGLGTWVTSNVTVQ